MGQATDTELWRRAVDGEPDAFGVLFERQTRVVYNYLFRRKADWTLAEDLTSIVFFEARRRCAEVTLDRHSRSGVAQLEGSGRAHRPPVEGGPADACAPLVVQAALGSQVECGRGVDEHAQLLPAASA